MAKNRYSMAVTGVMDFSITPFHYYNFQILKNRPASNAMLEGRALHLAVLEPEKFESEVYTTTFVPEGKFLYDTIADFKRYLTLHGKEHPKGKRDDFLKRFLEVRTAVHDESAITKPELDQILAQKTKISEGAYENICSMRDSVLSHPWVKAHIGCGNKEEKLIGEIDGVEIRGRTDWFFQSQRTGQWVIADLKKCRSARRWNWEKTVYENNYFIQAYLYRELFRQNYGEDALYAYIPCEGSAPFITEVYSADDAQIDAGERVVKIALARFKECVDSNKWPAYSDGKVQPCSIPEYGMKNIIALEEWGTEAY